MLRRLDAQAVRERPALGQLPDDLQAADRLGAEEPLEAHARRGILPLDLDHLPRLPIPGDQEVDLAPVLVPDVVQAEVFPLDVPGAMKLLQEGAGNEVLQAHAGVPLHHRVVVEVVFRLLQQGARDVPVIRGDAKDHVQIFQQAEPVVHGVPGLLQVAREGVGGHRAADPGTQQLDQRLDGLDVPDGGQGEQILFQDGVDVGALPPVVPGPRTSKERLREAAGAHQPLEDLVGPEIRVLQRLLHVDRMQPEVEVAAGEGIPGPAKGGEPGAARDQEGRGQPLHIVHALQPCLPALHLVQLVQDDQRLVPIPALFPEQQPMFRQIMVDVLVVRTEHPGERGLAGLPRAGQQDDLPVEVRRDRRLQVSFHP